MKAKSLLWSTCILKLQLITVAHAFLNITSTILRTGQIFNLTVGGGCNTTYKVILGDGTEKYINKPQGSISHSYSSSGDYVIFVKATTGLIQPACKRANSTVKVRDPIENMTFSLNTTFCKVGDTLGAIVNVTPNSQFSTFWRLSKTHDWTQTPIQCTEVGQFDLFLMANNGISTKTSACSVKISVMAFDFTFNPTVGMTNSSVRTTRTNLTGVQSGENYTFIWEYADGTTINTPGRTVQKYYQTPNPDPGHSVVLKIYNAQGASVNLQKHLRVLDPIQPPIQVSYPSLAGLNREVNFTVELLKGHDVTFQWDFGDNSTKRSTSKLSVSHVYLSMGIFCIDLVAVNDVSQAHTNLRIQVFTSVDGFGFIAPITPVQTGFATNVGIGITEGSNANVSVSFGDQSASVWIVQIDEVMDFFVISVWHNYTKSGHYNVNISAWNVLGSTVNSTIAIVQDPVCNLTIQMKYDTDCLEVNATLGIQLRIIGVDPEFLYDFGDGSNVTSRDLALNHSYTQHNEYNLTIIAWNRVSTVNQSYTIEVCKPEIPLKALKISTVRPVNFTDEVELVMSLAEGSDFDCTFAYGDGSFDYFGKESYNLSYYHDGITADKTPFTDLRFKVLHNYSFEGYYEVRVNCSNRLSKSNTFAYATVQKPISNFQLSPINPQILGHNFITEWDMANGTNVSFVLKVAGMPIYSSFKSNSGDQVDTSVNHISAAGEYTVEVHAENLVSNATVMTGVIIQEDITRLSVNTLTTTSDYGSHIPGLGPERNAFPCEYSINYTASPNKGTNLTYWWKFGDETEQNTTEPTITHTFAEGENEYWSNVTAFNLVSRVTETIRVKTEKSVQLLAVHNNSPVTVNRSTLFTLTFAKFGTQTCVAWDMGDGKGLYVFGGAHCQSRSPGHQLKTLTDENITIIQFSYEYDTVGAFWVNLFASNTVSQQSRRVKAVTVAMTCYYPNVTMKGVGEYATVAKTLKRSESISITSEITIDCEASKTTAFYWRVNRISSNAVQFEALPQKEVVPVPINDQSDLNIDARFLDFGFYELEFNVSMTGITGVSRTAIGFIQIVADPDSLTAFIDGGLFKRNKFGTYINLNAELSRDEDYNDFKQSSPKYVWLCRNFTEPGFNISGDLLSIPVASIPAKRKDFFNQNATKNNGGCFGTGAGRLNFIGPNVELDTRLGMRENQTYVITVVVETSTPFGIKRGAFSQAIDMISGGDPPEVVVSCHPSCPKKANIDQKQVLIGTCVGVCFGGNLRFLWELYQHTTPGMNPNDLSNMLKMSSSNLQEMSSTSTTSPSLTLKRETLKKDTGYTCVLKVFGPIGSAHGEYRHAFITNSPPENGTCVVEPKEGNAIDTTFSVNCSRWNDSDQPLSYEFAYLDIKQAVVFFENSNPWSQILLPMGDANNNFILQVRVRVVDQLNAATTLWFNITVNAPALNMSSLSEIIDNEDGLLKEAKKRGNWKKMVEIGNSVVSVINHLSNDQNSEDEKRNSTSAEKQEIEENWRRRVKLRRDVIEDFFELKVSTTAQVKLVASLLDVATQHYTELDTESQEMALLLFEEMVGVLRKGSQNNEGFFAVKETGAVLLSSIGSLMFASSSQARVDTEDSQVNLTGFLKNTTGDPLFSAKHRARKRSLKLYSLSDEIGSVVLQNVAAGEPQILIETRHFNLSLEKRLLADLGSSAVSDGQATFILPSLDDMATTFDLNGTEKYANVEMAMTSFPSNLFTWSETSKQINSYTVALNLKDSQQKPLNTSKFKSDVEIFIPRNTEPLSAGNRSYLIPLTDNEFIQYHRIEMPSSNFSIHAVIRPVNASVELKVLLSFGERPQPDKFDFNWTLPDLSSCSFKRNVSTMAAPSDLTSVSSVDSNNGSTSSLAKNSKEPVHETVFIDVEEDCGRDPYMVTVSNNDIDKIGEYYIAVYYKEPEVKTNADNQASSKTETHIRNRRDAVSCVGHRRMKRSCVIIPSPPPKPTTPSALKAGTRAPNVDFRGNTFNSNETLNYYIRVFLSNCLFWDEESENWINKGCKVGDKTQPGLTHCKCNHLTSFASDFVVAPNPIDFDKVFSADLSKNFVVLLVVCLLFGLYFVLVVIARRYDKMDLEKLGAAEVRSGAEATFNYLVSVHTGWRPSAGTTSGVCVLLFGDERESPPIPLVDFDRNVFQRGQENNFVVTLPWRLGNLTHIKIWHDNLGRSPSWYLSRVTIDDLSTQDRWYFICERWLAVEEDDGKVDRTLPVASKKELTHFQQLFVGKTVRELGDGHLWFSVISRPPNSPFTRVQRLSCCLSLLCCTMVTNAMFYRVGSAQNNSLIFSIGSFEFDFQGVIIGMEASLIMFPVTLALVQIFRTVRPKKPKQPSSEDGTTADEFLDLMDLSRRSSIERLPETSSEGQIIDVEYKKARKLKKWFNNGLPHGFAYVAWVLCFLSSVTSATFTIFYSLDWGPEIANNWLIAFTTSFFQSIVIIQPLKVLTVALIFALIIKKPVDSGDKLTSKKGLKRTGITETGSDIGFEMDDEDYDRYRPPDEETLYKAREERLKEVRMCAILKEIITYFLFLFLLLFVAYGNRDPHAYLLQKALNDQFVDLNQESVDLADAADVDLFWHWSRETLVQNLYPGVLYNNKSGAHKGFISDRNNYLVGISRLRQARMKKDSCVVIDMLKPLFKTCVAEYSLVEEDKEDYDIGWKFLNNSKTDSRRRWSVEEQFAFSKGDKTLIAYRDSSRVRFRRAIDPVYASTSGRHKRRRKRPGSTTKTYYVLNSAILPDGSINSCPSRWLYHKTLELRGYPFWGRLTLYGGGGYPADLGYDYQTALTVVADLHSHNWVDSQTRAVFAEFTVYNANTNLFGIAFLFVEFLPSGGAFSSAQFVTSRLYSYVGPFSNFILACQILMILFMFYFMYREGKQVYKMRLAYFREFFNWMEIALITCQLAVVVLFFGRLYQVDKNLLKLRYNPKDFVSFQYAGAADESLSYVMGLLVFLVNLRFLKLLRFNKRMSLLGSTIKKCTKPLGSFLITFMLVFLAYAMFGFMAFGITNDKFKTFISTIETQSSIILGDFDYEDLQRTDRVLGPVFFFTFMYFNVFYLLNMFLAIINDSFADVKAYSDKQQNDYEMVEFILSRFWQSVGLKRKRISTKGPFGNSFSGFPSSPPFQPSDYKHRQGSVSEISFEMNESVCKGNVNPVMSSLSLQLDKVTLLADKTRSHEQENDDMLLDVINILTQTKASSEYYDFDTRL